MDPAVVVNDTQAVRTPEKAVEGIGRFRIDPCPGTVGRPVSVGHRRLARTGVLPLVAGIVPTGVDGQVQGAVPVVAQFGIHALDVDGLHIHILHHLRLLGDHRLDIVVHQADKAVHLIGEAVPLGGFPGPEETQVEIVALFRFQGQVRIDGGTIAQQFPRNGQPDAVFIGGFQRKRLHRRPARPGPVAEVILRGDAFDFPDARHGGHLRLADAQVVDVVFHEGGVDHLAGEGRIVERKAQNVLREPVFRRLERGVVQVFLDVADITEKPVEAQRIRLAQHIIEIGTQEGHRAAVVAKRLAAAADLTVGTVDVSPVPIVFSVGGVDGL